MALPLAVTFVLPFRIIDWVKLGFELSIRGLMASMSSGDVMLTFTSEYSPGWKSSRLMSMANEEEQPNVQITNEASLVRLNFWLKDFNLLLIYCGFTKKKFPYDSILSEKLDFIEELYPPPPQKNTHGEAQLFLIGSRSYFLT